MTELLNVSYDTLIPNNVGLSSDRRVLRGLEKWHPGYLNWWKVLKHFSIFGFQKCLRSCGSAAR